MPKIKSYTPDWLLRPAPGHNLFVPSDADPKVASFSPYTTKKRPEPGPRRTIARRGTEVFVANGKELKWGDLVYLKDAWAAAQARHPAGVRIKREDSSGSFTSSINGQNGEEQLFDGYRVR